MQQHQQKQHEEMSSGKLLEEGKSSDALKMEKEKESEADKYKKKDNMRYSKLLFCFLGLQFSYVSWGFIQEHLMTKEYSVGRFRSSTFCVFSNRLLAMVVALAVIIYKRLTSKAPIKDAPFHYYAPSSISNSLSSWAQYEALKFISFPTQVLSKSCKVIPVMLVSNLLDFKVAPICIMNY